MDELLQILMFGCLATIITAICIKKKKKKVIGRRSYRRMWIREIYRKRRAQGLYHNLIAELKINDPILFFNFARMTPTSFEKLLNLCGPFLQKHSPREAINPGQRLILTLRFLATGDSYPSLGYAFRIAPSTICKIIKETCNIIWKVIPIKPLSKDDWLRIAEDYYNLWQLPNCVGSIDGKHIRIRCPANSGSRFFNYKKYFSTILLAICDAKYNFIYVDIGSYGAQSDGGVLRNSLFGQKLASGELNLPGGKNLPNTDIMAPFYFVGDEAFPLQMNLFRPFSKRRNVAMPQDEKIFNYRLSRARRTIENAFGVMVARFRILLREINAKPETADSIVKALTCLHNYIKKENGDFYCHSTFVDREVNGEVIPGQWRQEIEGDGALEAVELRFGNRNAPRSAWRVRDMLKEYLNGIGSYICPWQNEYINRTH